MYKTVNYSIELQIRLVGCTFRPGSISEPDSWWVGMDIKSPGRNSNECSKAVEGDKTLTIDQVFQAACDKITVGDL